MSPSPIPDRLRKPARCALCGAPVTPAYTPFCGQGCRDRDLLNWLGEGYAIPGRPAAPDVPPGPYED